MKVLKASNYYNVDCNAIPDNKIQLISGHYTTTAYTTETNSLEDITTVSNIRDENPSTLPIFSSSDLETTSNTFTGTFREYHNRGYDDDTGNWTWWREIYESVLGTIVIEISDDLPLTFISARALNPSGIHRTRTSTSGVMWSMGWLTDFTFINSNKIQTVKNYNESGYPSNKSEGAYVSQCNVYSTSVDSVKDGTRLINGKYVLKVTIKVEVFNGYQLGYYDEYEESGSTYITNVHGELWYDLINKFDLEFNYGKYTTEDVAFEIQAPGTTLAEAKNYPLNIEGNMYTGDKTHFDDRLIGGNDIPWYQYISNKILDAFSNGRYWMKAKVKAKWLIENNLDINSIVAVKDINNNYISERGSTSEHIYTFKIKNIEYVYDSGSFYANICLLQYEVVNRRSRVGIYENNTFVPAKTTNGEYIEVNAIIET